VHNMKFTNKHVISSDVETFYRQQHNTHNNSFEISKKIKVANFLIVV